MVCIISADLQEYSCEFGSGKYFALCGLGGIISCGTTHTAVVPLDLVKCRIQVFFLLVVVLPAKNCRISGLHFGMCKKCSCPGMSLSIVMYCMRDVINVCTYLEMIKITCLKICLDFV